LLSSTRTWRLEHCWASKVGRYDMEGKVVGMKYLLGLAEKGSLSYR
jgi:hypothetical protein